MVIPGLLIRSPTHRFPPALKPIRGRAGRGAAWSARLFWVQEVVGSNPAAPTIWSQRCHASPHLPAAEERHAVGPGRDPRVGARFRANLAAPSRSADGLDRQRRYTGAGPVAVQDARGGDGLRGAERYCLRYRIAAAAPPQAK